MNTPTPAQALGEAWQLIDGSRSVDGLSYTAIYWCRNTGALKTETTSDGRFRSGDGPRVLQPTIGQHFAGLSDSNEYAKRLLSEALDAERDPAESLRTLAVRASNALYWRTQTKQEAEARAEAAEARCAEAEGLLREAVDYLPHKLARRADAFLAARC